MINHELKIVRVNNVYHCGLYREQLIKNSFLYHIDNLRMWKSGHWVKYEHKSSKLLLRLHYDQLLITFDQKVIETLNVNGKLKGICKDDVLILIISIIGQEVRKIKFQIKDNAHQCLQKLGSRFPVLSFGSMMSKKKFIGKNRNIEDVLKKALEVKDNITPPIMPTEYKNFVNLCLLDPLFPQLVVETEKIVGEHFIDKKT